MKMVPLEPTQEMIDAFWITQGDCADKYKAMLSAAPSPSVEQRELVERLRAETEGALDELEKLPPNGLPHMALFKLSMRNLFALMDEAATALEALSGAREAALEEAAKVCEGHRDTAKTLRDETVGDSPLRTRFDANHVAHQIDADAIRALPAPPIA